jgi:two-component system, cell cycle sensor histidine kinase PleC
MDARAREIASSPQSAADIDRPSVVAADYNVAAARHQELLIQALRAAHEEAKAGSKAKTAFLASVSHEIRTPLNGIIGFAEMIERDVWGTIGDERYKQYAQDILVSSRRLQRILGDILEMARLESGRTRVQRETLELRDVLEEVLASVHERVSATSAPVTTRIVPGFPPLWTDRRHLRQILVNLLANAMEFTPETGNISISGHIGPSGDLEIAVADSGSGMTPDQLKSAVTRFGHAESEESRESGGIGLGLPLAKSLCTLLGGSLRIASAVGEGTTVTVVFPEDSIRERANEWAKAPDKPGEPAQRREVTNLP